MRSLREQGQRTNHEPWMLDDPDSEFLIVDSTIIRAQQHAPAAKKAGLKIRPLAVPAGA